jgi:hypothetical protein
MIQGQQFPDYVFQEYPKVVKSTELDAKGQPLLVTVNSKEEEQAITKHEDQPTETKASVHVDKPYVDLSDEELEAELEARRLARRDKPASENLPGKPPLVPGPGKAPPAVAKTQAEKLAETPGGVGKE